MDRKAPLNKNIFSIIIALLAIVWLPVTQADYLGTENLRIFPTPIDDITDGYDIGDRIDFVIEVTPRDTGSTEGNAAWSTFYVPPGAKVVAARYVDTDGSGGYIEAAADDVDNTYDGFGSRGAPTYGAGLGQGFVNEVQQDTGIFYSTNSRTAQILPAGLTASTLIPTGIKTVVIPFNQWDFDQLEAFGIKNDDGNFSNNDGKGNTPMLLGSPNKGTGSPVAGPGTYYTNDYDPSDVGNEYSNAGPWQRIETLGDKIGGSGTVMPAGIIGAITNTSVDATGGFDLAQVFMSGTPATKFLPTNTNAVRIVHGARRLGDIERWSVILEITDVSLFLAALDAGEVCADSIPADTTPAKDNNWRYYEVSRSCADLNSEAALVKTITDPASGAALVNGQAVTYQFTFTNLHTDALTNVIATDEGITNLNLALEGVSGCPVADAYDGIISSGGTAAFTGIAGNIASWATIPSLPVGASVTYTVCGTVSGTFGQQVDNEARITYDGCLSGTTPCLTSIASVPISNIISGTVYDDTNQNGVLSVGEIGIPGVIVELYLDVNGDGILDGGDTIASTTVTNSAGYYEFVAIPTGNYIIVETNPVSLPRNTGDADNTPIDCAISGTNNGCDTIGGGTSGAPASIAVISSTNLTEQDFFDTIDGVDLKIVKSDSLDPVVPGDTLVYTLDISNIGTLPATGVVVTDTLPVGVTWVSTLNSTDPDACTTDLVLDCNCTVPDGTQLGGMICQIGGLAAGASESITITVTID